MNSQSQEKAKLEFELAIIKELYKNKKISENQCGYAINKIQNRIDEIVEPSDLVSACININI